MGRVRTREGKGILVEDMVGSEAWRLADPQAHGRKSGRAPGQPAPSALRSACLLHQNKSYPYPGQTSPPYPIFSLTTGTDAGIWRQRHEVGSWHQSLLGHPPAHLPLQPGSTVGHMPSASVLGGHGSAQASRPQACRVGPHTGPGACGTPRGLSSEMTVWVGSISLT